MGEGAKRISIILHDLDLEIVGGLCQKAGFSRSAAIRVMIRKFGETDAKLAELGQD